MKKTGGIMQRVIRAAIIVTLIIYFGATAHARNAKNYVIYANPTSLSFSVPMDGAVATQSVKVNDTTPGPLPFTLSVDQPWVTINTTSSTTAGGGVVLQFGVNPAGMQAGNYTGHVILTASGVANSPMAFPVTLTVTSSTNAGAPAIMTQPAGRTVVAGKAATFRVTASGNSPMKYQWKKNGVAISGATSSSYATPPVVVSDNNARFTAEVSNNLGVAQSEDAVLRVMQGRNYVIYANPTSLTFSLKAGAEQATQSVKVNDTTPGPLPFTLSVDQPWVTISTTSSTTAGGGVVLQFGVNPAGMQAGSYTGHVILTASGVANSPMAFPVTLTVTSSTNAGAPAIMTQPAGQTVVAGKAATFRVTASGNSPMKYQWKKNGVAISGATSSSYATPPVVVSDNNARFTAEVSNNLGVAQSEDAVLRVMQGRNYVIYANPTSLTFSLKAGAEQATQSVKVNDTTPGPLPFTLSVDQPWVTISTTSSTTAGGGVVLQFGVNPAGMQAGSYTGHVILTASGVANSPMAFPVTLTVTSSTNAGAPAIMTQPAGQTVVAGKAATFRVTASGNSPMKYQWKKNGVAISGATSSSYATPPVVVSDNNARFTAEVSNNLGVAQSEDAVLRVMQGRNYVIYANPTSLTFSLKAGAGQATQSVKVNDTTPGPLPFTLSVDQPWVTISTTSSTTAGGGVVLQFGVNPAGMQAGSYTGHVILTASGVANSPMAFPVTLTVTSSTDAGAPAILTQPAGQTVVAGKAATFRVTASGNSPMKYQWKKNGVAISGATSSSYSTPPVAVSDNNARFTAEVSNNLGAAQSEDAVLTVMQGRNYVIYANPTSLTFSLKAGAGQATQSVKVNDTTPGPLPFTLSVDQPWVTISTTSSTTAGGGVVLQFGVNPAGMQAGSYTGHVILTASGVANSPMAFPVTLAIASTSTSSKSAVAPTISSQP